MGTVLIIVIVVIVVLIACSGRDLQRHGPRAATGSTRPGAGSTCSSSAGTT